MWGANTMRAWWAESLHFMVCWIAPGWIPDTHQSHSLTPLCKWTRERKYGKRFLSWDKDWETSLIKYCHGQNRLNLGILIKLITKKHQSRIIKKKIITFFLMLSSFPGSTSSPPSSAERWGMGIMVSSLQVFLPFLPPQRKESCSSVGSLPEHTVLY